MKLIGLIGGMSWESSAVYYRELNEGVRQRLGGLHSAQCLLYSVDFAQIEQLQTEQRWEDAAVILGGAAVALERAGAECLLLCTNTMHQVASAIELAVDVPLLHIADATAEAIQRAGVKCVGLLGTRYTMEQAFYRGRLETKHGLTVLVPNEDQRAQIHRIIYQELCIGRVLEPSRSFYRAAIAHLVDKGAEAIILGCTEIGMLVSSADSTVPLFDTTKEHVRAALEFALR